MVKRYLSEVQEGLVPQTFFDRNFAGDNAQANAELKNLLNIESLFDYPKPAKLIQRLLQISTSYKSGDLVLDFFAGSATAAHSVIQQNAEDGGNRKWICVQIPEEVDEDSEAAKAEYKTIAGIARERIRRAGNEIEEKVGEVTAQVRFKKEEEGDSPAKVNEFFGGFDGPKYETDLGFKSFELQQSNYRQWHELTEEDDEAKLKEQVRLFAEKPLVDEYDEESVVYEVLLKEGFDLNSEVKQEKMGELDAWTASDNTTERRIVVSFAKELTKDQIESLGLGEDDTFVCFDYALDDETKVNITRNLDVKVI
jgi:adenine-specific DNA-methyltransferase